MKDMEDRMKIFEKKTKPIEYRKIEDKNKKELADSLMIELEKPEIINKITCKYCSLKENVKVEFACGDHMCDICLNDYLIKSFNKREIYGKLILCQFCSLKKEISMF